MGRFRNSRACSASPCASTARLASGASSRPSSRTAPSPPSWHASRGWCRFVAAESVSPRATCSSCRGPLTWRCASFSAFISLSLAFIWAMAARSFVRFSYDVRPAVGRNAFFGSCHCLPATSLSVWPTWWEVAGARPASDGPTVLAHAKWLGRLCGRFGH